MARSRNIKPQFFANENLSEVAPLGRLLFIGLWSICDFKGDFEWRPKRIKAQLFPYEACDIPKYCLELEALGFLHFFSDGEKIYCHVVNFQKHQNPHPNERQKGSGIPECSNELRQLVDLESLTINRDKSRVIQERSESGHADSLILNPDPLNGSENEVLSNDSCCHGVSPLIEKNFEQFWTSYPRKTNRKTALKSFAQLKPNDKLLEKIIANINLRLSTNEWSESNKKHIPHPSTYLNQSRWEDELLHEVTKNPEDYIQ